MLDGDLYVAEKCLLQLLNKHYVRSAQHLSVELPPIPYQPIQFPLRPWNFKLLLTSLSVACVGVTPYIHFSVRQHTSFPALAIFFPFSRVVGGLLCVFPGQLMLQYRIEKILKQRILFKGINDLLADQNFKIPTRFIGLWDQSHASEACLSSLEKFLEGPDAETHSAAPFLEYLAGILHLPADSSVTELALALKPYLTKTLAWWEMLFALLFGFLMTIIGYIGCFTIVQNSSTPSDTYIWLALELALALIRLLTWALNPPWDDSDGVRLRLDPQKTRSLHDTFGIDENTAEPVKIKIIRDTGFFWEVLTAYSGPVNLDALEVKRIHGVQHSYSWIRREAGSGSTDILCIILERVFGEDTVMCWINHNQDDLEFHRARID
ncbi:hypothetical protein C8R44DRAFT_991958 [Mycena epipterygia]|nr:hypothetical protein C8R44DRAFT_991958 [Mycena epipterygia]